MRQAQTVWEHRARAAEGREGIDTAHRRKKDGLNHKSTGKSNFLERNQLAKENRKNPRCYRTSKLLSLTEEREREQPNRQQNVRNQQASLSNNLTLK